MSTDKAISKFNNDTEIKVFLHKNYLNQIRNFFGDEKQAMKFLSSVMSSIQKLPALLECEPMSIINSFMTMAQLGLMPSDVSGEAYVLPYKKGYSENKVAQFQLGYQGLITLAYRAGVKSIFADIVRKNDKIELANGGIIHSIDPTKTMAERGDVIGAYAVINYQGEMMGKYMHIDDIYEHAKNFSKSFNSDFSPWKEKNDPEGWMAKKTVLKQAMKLVPKNETINKAIAYDNQDSRISEVKGMVAEGELSMGKFLTDGKENKKTKGAKNEKNGMESAGSEENQG